MGYWAKKISKQTIGSFQFDSDCLSIVENIFVVLK